MNPTTRRDLFRMLPVISLAPTVPSFIATLARASTAERDGRILVVVQLNGGNDGLNTVVPYGDEAYAKNRPSLKVPTAKLIKVSDGIGLHPAMGQAGKLLESGRLAIIPGVGYPNPSRSHFASMAIWHTARLDEEEHDGPGWLGRSLDAAPSASSVYVGAGSIPIAIRGRRAPASSLERIGDLTLDPTVARPDLSNSRRRPRRVCSPEHARRLRVERPAGRCGQGPVVVGPLSWYRFGGPAETGRPSDQGGLRIAGVLYVAGGLRYALAAVLHAFRPTR